MNRQAVLIWAMDMIKRVLGLEPNSFGPDSKLHDDLGADSLDFVDIEDEVAEEYGVKLHDIEEWKWGTCKATPDSMTNLICDELGIQTETISQ